MIVSRLLGVLFLLFYSFSQTAFAGNDASSRHGNVKNVPAPEGIEKYIVFRADGKFQSVDGSIFQDGLIDGDGMFFQREIMQRSEGEIIQNRNEALDFYQQRFGVDVLNNDAFLFTGIYVTPEMRLRAYTISGENVPAEGWEVRDGGWGAFVIDPEGVTLGGEFEGVHIPANSALFYGDYNIKMEKRNGRRNGKTKELVIHYQSQAPFIPNQFGNGIISCDLSNDKYGVGLAGGPFLGRIINENLLFQQDVRNVLIFPEEQ